MKTKLSFISLLLVLAIIMSGCMKYENSIVCNSDNTISIASTVLINKEKYDSYMESMSQTNGNTNENSFGIQVDADKPIFQDSIVSDMDLETINGVEYYVQRESKTFTQDELSKNTQSLLASSDSFYYCMSKDYLSAGTDNSGEESSEIMYSLTDKLSMTVTLQSPIAETNGEILEDNKVYFVWNKVNNAETSFDFTWYAYGKNSDRNLEVDNVRMNEIIDKINSDSKEIIELKPIVKPNKDTKEPTILGVSNGKVYKKSVTVYVKDDSGKVSVKVNGKKKSIKFISKGKKKGYYSFKLSKSGKYKIEVSDKSGNKTCKSIKIRKGKK